MSLMSGLSSSLHLKHVQRPSLARRHSARRAFRRWYPTQCTRHALTMGALDLSGKWLKDQENSDLNAYGEMLSLLGLSGIRKTGALKLINTLALEHSTEEPHFIVRYVASRVQFLKSVEEFTLGHSVEMPRRDGEKGVQIGAMTQDDTQVQTVITWGEPNPGSEEQQLVETTAFGLEQGQGQTARVAQTIGVATFVCNTGNIHN